MLVLTRKKTESIHLGNDIVIKIVQTGKGAVKIGIEAPAHVRIVRGELAEGLLPQAELSIISNVHDDELVAI